MSRPVEVCQRLVDRFAPRTDAYNVWTGSQYVTRHEPLTGAVVLDAITRRVPVGTWLPGADGLTAVGVLDLDRPDGQAVAAAIEAATEEEDVFWVCVPSERGRAHLWLVLAEPVGWGTMHRALRGALALAGLTEDGIELRPDRYTVGTLGRALRLPTLPHKDTGRRGSMTDPATGRALGRTLTEQLDRVDDLVVSVRLIAPLVAAAPMDPEPAHVARREPWHHDGRLSPIEEFNARVTVTDVLVRRFGIPPDRARPGRAIRCVAHHPDDHPSLSIMPDDRRVLCHMPTCVLAGRGADAWALHTLEVGR